MDSFVHRLMHEGIKLLGEAGIRGVNRTEAPGDRADRTEPTVTAATVIGWIENGEKGSYNL